MALSASTVRGLRRLGDSIGRVPSFGFGLAYLVAIPLFALAYYLFLPFDFFHATARYEPLVVTQAESVAKRLGEAFMNAAAGDGPGHPTINGSRVPLEQQAPPQLPMFAIQPEPDRVRIFGLIVLDESRSQRFLRVALDFSAGSFNPARIRGSGESWVFANVNATLLEGDKDVSLPQLFPCGFDTNPIRTCLLMTMNDYWTLRSLQNTAAGIPTPLQASYLRMLYFSAVTISTLGYGDIVPITSRARAFVTVEIILGPLLFGLFLNSLLKERNTDAHLPLCR